MNASCHSSSVISSARPAQAVTRGRRCSKVLSKLGRARLAVAATLAGVGVAGLALASAGQASAASQMQWVMTSGNISVQSRLDPAVASHFFNTPSSFGAEASLVASPVQRGYAATPMLDYTSYAQFAANVAAKRISYPYKWVMYDAEHWAGTPVAEQQDPVGYMRKFGQLAHAHGLKVLMAPALDLAVVPGSRLPRLRREPAANWYVRVGIATAAAASGSIYILQDESNEASVSAYASLYNSVAAQARTASPAIKVFSEVSGDNGSTAQMVTAARSIRPDGFFVAAAGKTAQTGQFFRQMAAAGY